MKVSNILSALGLTLLDIFGYILLVLIIGVILGFTCMVFGVLASVVLKFFDISVANNDVFWVGETVLVILALIGIALYMFVCKLRKIQDREIKENGVAPYVQKNP
jgi:hypothetical protein